MGLNSKRNSEAMPGVVEFNCDFSFISLHRSHVASTTMPAIRNERSSAIKRNEAAESELDSKRTAETKTEAAPAEPKVGWQLRHSSYTNNTMATTHCT